MRSRPLGAFNQCHERKSMEQKRERLVLAPIWAGVLPALIAVLQNGTEEGQRMAARELRRMAEAADSYNAILKQEKQL